MFGGPASTSRSPRCPRRAVPAFGGLTVTPAAGLSRLAEADLIAVAPPATPSRPVDPTVPYVDDDPILTSAGLSAGIDLCLHLTRGRAIGPAVQFPPHPVAVLFLPGRHRAA